MAVLRFIMGAFKSREVMEAEWPEDEPPLDDDRLLLSNWARVVQRQGEMIVHLCVIEDTKLQLAALLPGVLERVPAWLEARINEEPMTLEIFFTGLAQAVAVHRETIERVIAEQVEDPDPIRKVLAESPVPTGGKDEHRSALMKAVLEAISANTTALADIAHDLEMVHGNLLVVEDDGVDGLAAEPGARFDFTVWNQGQGQEDEEDGDYEDQDEDEDGGGPDNYDED